MTPWGDSRTLRDRKLRPGPGTPPEEVAQNQRERLFGAMVASISERGYRATRVEDLVRVSGVARRTFYELFDSKEACFVGALEGMILAGVSVVGATVGDSLPADATWEDQVGAAIDAFVAMAETQPAPSRLLLLEAHCAGPAAMAPQDAAFAGLEAIGRRLAGRHPELAGLPREVMVAATGMVQETARLRLWEGREDELAEVGSALTALICSYRPPPVPLRQTARPPAFPPETIEAHDRGERALRGFAAVIAERGFAAVTIEEVVKRAGISATTFYTSFRDKEDALMAAIDSASSQLVAAVLPVFRRADDWPRGVRAAIGAFLNFLASRPALAQLLMVEVYAAGPAAVHERTERLQPLESLLAPVIQADPDRGEFEVQAVFAGILAVISKYIRRSGPTGLPSLAPVCTYLVLAPFIGAREATTAANGDGQARAVGGDASNADEADWLRRIAANRR